MNAEKTILEEQSEIETALRHLTNIAAKLPDALKPLVRLAPPPGFRAEVSLRHAKGDRQVKRNSPAGKWSPDSGLVAISYKASLADEQHVLEAEKDAVMHADPAPPAEAAEDPSRDIVIALAKAELVPQLGFVSLKWFRDTYLPQQGHTWANGPEARQRALVDAIDRRWILTSKVANPKNPQYPVTAIKVNRPLAEVRKILDQEPGFHSTFRPIVMPGEPLSETVLRDRR